MYETSSSPAMGEIAGLVSEKSLLFENKLLMKYFFVKGKRIILTSPKYFSAWDNAQNNELIIQPCRL